MKHEYRIDSAADARHVTDGQHAKDPRKVDRLGRHPKGPKLDHYRHGGLHSGGGNGFSVDLTAFQQALTELNDHCETLTNRIEAVANVTGNLPDGSGPVATVVGQAFSHRLGPEGGLHDTLRSHLTLMLHILEQLGKTRTNYQQVEQAMLDRITLLPEAQQ